LVKVLAFDGWVTTISRPASTYQVEYSSRSREDVGAINLPFKDGYTYIYVSISDNEMHNR